MIVVVDTLIDVVDFVYTIDTRIYTFQFIVQNDIFFNISYSDLFARQPAPPPY